MPEDSSTFKIPSFAPPEAYNFATTKSTFAVYQELTAIAEEIEKCRARNL